jgi:hypothetical protein
MNQAWYAHMNNKRKMKKKNLFKEPTFCFIDALYSLFGFDLINLSLILIISLHLLVLGLICSSFSRSLRSIIRLFMYGVSVFLM